MGPIFTRPAGDPGAPSIQAARDLVRTSPCSGCQHVASSGPGATRPGRAGRRDGGAGGGRPRPEPDGPVGPGWTRGMNCIWAREANSKLLSHRGLIIQGLVAAASGSTVAGVPLRDGGSRQVF